MAAAVAPASAVGSGLDSLTKRPRTPNDPYTVLTDEQIRNIKKEVSPHFHSVSAPRPLESLVSKPGGRQYVDRYCAVTSQHLTRGLSGTQPFGWIDSQKVRYPPEEYNTCRGRAAVRWGPNKAGERTRSHFFGESIDRYTNIDMYRRNPTNYPGRVVMDCGRPSDGYYAQKYPSRTTWYQSNAPLNRNVIMETVHRKSSSEYNAIKRHEMATRDSRRGQWPEFSEYTAKYLLNMKTPVKTTGLQEKKRHIVSAAM